MQITIAENHTERALVAALKLGKQSADTALRNESIDSIIARATREQIRLHVASDKVGDDVKALVGEDQYFQAMWASYNKPGSTIPESIVIGLEERAALVIIPAGA